MSRLVVFIMSLYNCSIHTLHSCITGMPQRPEVTLEIWEMYNMIHKNSEYNHSKQSTAKSLLQKVWDALHSIRCFHYIDVIMTTRASQITSLTFVNSTVSSDADQRKHQSSTSLAFVWGIHRDRWIPRTKRQLRGKCFHLMTSSCHVELAGVWTLVLNNQWSVVNGLWSVSVVNDTSRWTEGDRFHKDKYVPQYIYSIHSNVYKTRYESHIADILHGVLV